MGNRFLWLSIRDNSSQEQNRPPRPSDAPVVALKSREKNEMCHTAHPTRPSIIGNDRLAFRVQKGCKSATVTAANIKIVYACFLINNYYGISHQTETFSFLYVKPVFTHNAYVSFLKQI